MDGRLSLFLLVGSMGLTTGSTPTARQELWSRTPYKYSTYCRTTMATKFLIGWHCRQIGQSTFVAYHMDYKLGTEICIPQKGKEVNNLIGFACNLTVRIGGKNRQLLFWCRQSIRDKWIKETKPRTSIENRPIFVIPSRFWGNGNQMRWCRTFNPCSS